MTVPVRLYHDEDLGVIRITQTGMPGVRFPSIYLKKVIHTLDTHEGLNECYLAKIGVRLAGGSVILYDYDGPSKRDCVRLNKGQAQRFSAAVKAQFPGLL